MRLLAVLVILIAVVSTAPARLPTTALAPVPHFITSGAWRAYVPVGRTLVTAPTVSSFEIDGMRWSAAANAEFAVPRGYFLGPADDPAHGSLYGATPTWTSIVLDQVTQSGVVHVPEPGEQQLLAADLRRWRAAAVVLDPRRTNAAALRLTLEAFLGPPRQIDDVDLWDLRARL